MYKIFENELLILRLQAKAPTDAMTFVVATPLTLGERYRNLLLSVWGFEVLFDVVFTIVMWTFNPSKRNDVYEEQSVYFALAMLGSCCCIFKWIYILLIATFGSLKELMKINKERGDVRALISGGHLKDATETILIKRGTLQNAVDLAYVKSIFKIFVFFEVY